MSIQAEFEAANGKFVSNFTDGDKAMPPARHTAIVTCMDARLHPEKFLGLNIGDAHVIRNAGGRVSEDALRSLIISQRLLGTKEIFIIHHTNCGMETFGTLLMQLPVDMKDLYAPGPLPMEVVFLCNPLGPFAKNGDLRAKIKADLGVDAGERDYLPFKGLEESVRTDVQIVKDSNLIPNNIPVHGYVYEVETGKLVPVA